jgi:hypothetical protein
MVETAVDSRRKIYYVDEPQDEACSIGRKDLATREFRPHASERQISIRNSTPAYSRFGPEQRGLGTVREERCCIAVKPIAVQR